MVESIVSSFGDVITTIIPHYISELFICEAFAEVNRVRNNLVVTFLGISHHIFADQQPKQQFDILCTEKCKTA